MQKNRIEIAGYFAAKAELRYMPSGTKVANARLGETYRFMGHDGAPQSHTNWHNLVFYNAVADVAVTYEQGDNVYVEGSIQQRKFTPADGITRTVHEVHVRSCHLIGSPRFEREQPPVEGSTSSSEAALGGNRYEDEWPVGPA
jgi:single-strand DNA-binding protein